MLYKYTVVQYMQLFMYRTANKRVENLEQLQELYAERKRQLKKLNYMIQNQPSVPPSPVKSPSVMLTRLEENKSNTNDFQKKQIAGKFWEMSETSLRAWNNLKHPTTKSCQCLTSDNEGNHDLSPNYSRVPSYPLPPPICSSNSCTSSSSSSPSRPHSPERSESQNPMGNIETSKIKRVMDRIWPKKQVTNKQAVASGNARKRWKKLGIHGVHKILELKNEIKEIQEEKIKV